MHAPRELDRRELVPETEVLLRQAQGWLHSDPPPAVLAAAVTAAAAVEEPKPNVRMDRRNPRN